MDKDKIMLAVSFIGLIMIIPSIFLLNAFIYVGFSIGVGRTVASVFLGIVGLGVFLNGVNFFKDDSQNG